MADRRAPYARTLAVLRVLSWLYQYPPLSWYMKLIDWLSGQNRRFIATLAVCWSVTIAVIAWRVIDGG